MKKRWSPALILILILYITLYFFIVIGCTSKMKEERISSSESKTWNESKKLLNPGEYIYNIFLSNHHNMWAVGSYGKIFHYDGKDWILIPAPDKARGYNLFDLFFLTPDNGWAVGEAMTIPIKQGVIIHWDGKKWQYIDNPSTDSLTAIYFTSADNGWAVGSNSHILHFDGSKWEKIAPPRFCYLSDVYFISADNGWAVGNEGVILHYDGKNWKEFASPTKEPLYGVSFPDPHEGWAVGEIGTILHYQDGVWKSYESPTDFMLFSIYFKSPMQGYAVGTAGTIISYKYKEKKWDILPRPTREFLYTILYENPLGLIVAGRDKVIFNKPREAE